MALPSSCVSVDQYDSFSSSHHRCYFPIGTIFTPPDLGKGEITVHIPKEKSLTITSATFLANDLDPATIFLSTDAADSVPLCTVSSRTTVAGLGLCLVGPQTIKVSSNGTAGVSILGSVSPATFEYQNLTLRECGKVNENKASADTVTVDAKTFTKKRKLSNVNTPMEPNEATNDNDSTNRESLQPDQNEGDSRKQLSKRQRKKLAKQKAKELADAVAFLNKHQSKLKHMESNQTMPKDTVSLMKERRLPGGVLVKDIIIGIGAPVKLGHKVSILYEGAFPDGRVFDRNKNRNSPLTFRQGTGEVIRGLEKGIEGMKVGGEREITIPPKQGYGKSGSGDIVPPNATLVFSVQLIGLGS